MAAYVWRHTQYHWDNHARVLPAHIRAHTLTYRKSLFNEREVFARRCMRVCGDTHW